MAGLDVTFESPRSTSNVKKYCKIRIFHKCPISNEIVDSGIEFDPDKQCGEAKRMAMHTFAFIQKQECSRCRGKPHAETHRFWARVVIPEVGAHDTPLTPGESKLDEVIDTSLSIILDSVV